MATDSLIPELVYCANGNATFARIAIDAGYTYGAQLPNTVYYPPDFADQNWKNPDFGEYMRALKIHNPRIATVLDLERWDQLAQVIWWIVNAAQHVTEAVIVIPKVSKIIGCFPKTINGRQIRLGYSVPTKFGGTSVPIWEFNGWPVHLLGGNPRKQLELAQYVNVLSVDGNMMLKMATQYNSFHDYQKRTKYGPWPSLTQFDGQRWGDGSSTADAPYEAFRRSCNDVRRMWNEFHTYTS